ncbi:LTA synthase family protein [Lentisphaerota bacterium WC36G]|nr:LTA synthase family protein [Lentisphaerae bacterium WC36]
MKQLFYHKNFVLLFLILVIPELFSGYFSLTPLTSTLLLCLGTIFYTYFIYSLCLFNKHKNSFCAVVLITVFSALFFTFNMLELVCYYLSAESFNFGFFYHFNLNTLDEEVFNAFKWQIIVFICVVIVAMVLFYFNSRSLVKRKYYHKSIKIKSNYHKRIFTKTLLILFFLGGFIYCEASPVKFLKVYWQMYKIEVAPFNKKMGEKYHFPLNFVTKNKVKIEKNSQKNLIIIFLEGYDNAFLNNNFYPDLTPRLNKLLTQKNDGIRVTNFTNISEARNASFTLSGTYTALTGSVFSRLHLAQNNKSDFNEEDSNKGFNLTTANQFSSLPLILKKAYYYQVFIKSAPLEFAGTKVFLENQGYDEKISSANFKTSQMQGGQWGVYDVELYKVVKKKIVELSKLNQSFHLTMTTVDSHPPGMSNPRGKKYQISASFPLKEYNKKMLDAIYDGDSLVVDFIDYIKNSALAKNTMIALASDHTVKEGCFRRFNLANNIGGMTFMLIEFNDKADRSINKAGATFDIAPTILDALGVQSNYIFPVGESLLKENTNDQRLKWSESRERAWESFCQFHSDKISQRLTKISIKQEPFFHLLLNGKNQITLFTDNVAKVSMPKVNMVFFVELSKTRSVLKKGCIVKEDFNFSTALNNKFNEYIYIMDSSLAKKYRYIEESEPSNNYALVHIKNGQITYKIAGKNAVEKLSITLP